LQITIAVSAGDFFDRITILRIKADRIGDPAKAANVRAELVELERTAGDLGGITPDVEDLVRQLHSINAELWDIEEAKRDHEQRTSFDAGFIELARAVYLKNDRRAALKRQISIALGSAVFEEKSHNLY
jgi:hypothetical protein